MYTITPYFISSISMMVEPTTSITFEDWVYVFNYTDVFWWVVTDGKTIEELRYNIREAMSLHFEWVDDLSWNHKVNKARDFTVPMHLSFSNFSYAAQLQTN